MATEETAGSVHDSRLSPLALFSSPNGPKKQLRKEHESSLNKTFGKDNPVKPDMNLFKNLILPKESCDMQSLSSQRYSDATFSNSNELKETETWTLFDHILDVMITTSIPKVQPDEMES